MPDSFATKHEDKDIKLGQVFAQSKANEDQIRGVAESQRELKQDFGKALLSVLDEIRALRADLATVAKEARPNLGTMAVWAGVVIAFIVAVSTPIGFFAVREWDATRQAAKALDERIAMQLIPSNSRLLEQITTTEARVTRLQDWNDKQVEAELNELRDRRRQDNKPK